MFGAFELGEDQGGKSGSGAQFARSLVGVYLKVTESPGQSAFQPPVSFVSVHPVGSHGWSGVVGGESASALPSFLSAKAGDPSIGQNAENSLLK